jgi:hypothetical protein
LFLILIIYFHQLEVLLPPPSTWPSLDSYFTFKTLQRICKRNGVIGKDVMHS